MTATPLTVSLFDAALKEIYIDGVPENLANRKRRLWSKLEKKDDFEGDLMPIPVVGGNPPGASHSIDHALANAYYGSYKKFALTRVRDFSAVQINAEAIKASRSKRGSFLEAKKTEIDGMLSNLGHRANIAAYGTGSRSIGRLDTYTSGNTVTLQDKADTKNFSIGQWVTAATTETGGSELDSGHAAQVTHINEDAGTVTFADLSLISGIATNDYLYTEGDYDLGMKGLMGWIPYTAPTSGDSFFGVDRSVNVGVYAGHRLDGSSMTLEEAIMQMGETLAKTGASDTLDCFVSHTRFNELAKGLGSTVEQSAGGDGKVGFTGFKIYTSGGIVTVWPDPDCPAAYCWVLDMSTWTFHSLGAVPHLVDDDGNMATRSSTSDAIDVRARWYGNLACKAPGWNGVIYLG